MSTIASTKLHKELLAEPEIHQFVTDMTELLKVEVIQSLQPLAKGGPNIPVKVSTRVARRDRRTSMTAEKGVGGVVVRHVQTMPTARRQAMLNHASSATAITPSLRATAQRFAIAIDANGDSGKPIVNRIDAKVKFAQLGQALRGGRLQRLLALLGAQPAAGAVANQGIRFRLHEVNCIDDTSEAAKDEMAMGGIAVNDDETTVTINEFSLGEFKKGNKRTFNPPKELASFAFEGEFPKNVAVFVALAEKDRGGFSEFLAELYESIEDELGVILTAVGAAAGALVGGQIGGTLGGVIGGPIGVVIGVVAGAILGALVAWLTNVAKDDLYEPQVAGLTLPTADSDFGTTGLNSGILSLVFSDHGGQYQVNYSWELRR